MDKALTVKWAARKVSVQAGEYVEAQQVVTENASADGRFVIRPTGSVKYCYSNGFHGQLSRRWVWTGFRLTDNSATLPAWVAKSATERTRTACKREAARRIAKGY